MVQRAFFTVVKWLLSSYLLLFHLPLLAKETFFLPATAWRQAPIAWHTVPPLPAPDGLRPCCAFGYNLHAKLFFIPVPFYKIYNIVDAQHVGQHRYNNRPFNSIINLLGLGAEDNGLVYSQHGGFIDIAHVRDSADNTLYLFSQFYAHLGQPWQIDREAELASRHIVLSAFDTRPFTAAQRYTIATWLAARIAYQLAAWHEIAQWYGYESVPGFPEGVSAFSPEDLYSNLLGVQLAAQLILQGDAQNLTNYQQHMDRLLPLALEQLGSGSFTTTEQHFDAIDGLWWDSHQRLPEKFLLLKRNYLTDSDRLPSKVPQTTSSLQRLSLPTTFRWQTIEQGHLQQHQLDYDNLAQLQLRPTKHMAQLPPKQPYYTVSDFAYLAQYAKKQDDLILQKLAKQHKSQ